MKNREYGRIFASILCVLFACTLCFTAFAETAAAGLPADQADAEEIIHRLWGFCVGWTEGDTDRMLELCAPEWKQEQEDPRQALLKLLASGKPDGYRINSVSGANGDPARTASVTLRRAAEDGVYAYSLHEITFRLDPDAFYTLDPQGIGAGEPAEPVPEEELVLLTPEEIIRSNLAFHEDEGIYEKLVPVSLSIEKQGIRVEVVSGFVKGWEACFMVSVQDTEGKYDGFVLDPSFTDIMEGAYSRRWMNLYHDSAERKDIYAVFYDLSRQMQPEDGSVTVGVSEIWLKEVKTVDLLPLLEQYGRSEDGVSPTLSERSSFRAEKGTVPKDVKVLDHKEPLDVPLFRDVCLTGIGWIGDQLHVQFHNKGRDFLEMKNGRGSACSVWSGATVYGRPFEETYINYSPLDWDSDDDGWSDWTEFIINCSPEEAEKLELKTEISVTEEILENDWNVQVPLEGVCTATDPEPKPVPDEEADESGDAGSPEKEDGTEYTTAELLRNDFTLYRLWEFFCRWAQADTDNLPESLTDELKYGGQQTQALIRELLARGVPLAYQINSVTGADGETVRKYTCTVLMDPENGNAPRYQQYEISMKRDQWRYSVDLSALTCLGDADRDPALQTVSLSAEAIIRDHMAYYHPEVSEQLRPIGLSCRNNGIRMDVISGLVTEDEAWFIYSLEDPEGKYDDSSCEIFDLVNDIGTQEYFSTAAVYRDRREHKTYMMWKSHYSEPVVTDDRTVYYARTAWADLMPLLKQYGEAAEGVPAPEDIRDRDGGVPDDVKDMKVLNYTRPPELSLDENVSLSGIGWIDDRLHVQVHLQCLLLWSMWVEASVPGKADPALPYSPLGWYTEDGEWVEYVFDCTPEDMEKMSLFLSETVAREHVQGPWKVQFPLSMISPEYR